MLRLCFSSGDLFIEFCKLDSLLFECLGLIGQILLLAFSRQATSFNFLVTMLNFAGAKFRSFQLLLGSLTGFAKSRLLISQEHFSTVEVRAESLDRFLTRLNIREFRFEAFLVFAQPFSRRSMTSCRRWTSASNRLISACRRPSSSATLLVCAKSISS